MIKKIVLGLLFAAIPVAALVSIRRVNAQAYPVIQQAVTQYDVEHEKLNYFWDERTGLCFASATFVTAYGARVTTFTNVPCTEKVWTLIRGGK